MNREPGHSSPALHVEAVAGRTAHTVLLLHGGGVGGWMWRPLMEHLGDQWTYLVPDLPGHDRSADQPYRSHAQTVDALAAVVEEHVDGPVSVVGFSLGAQLAVLLASQRPDLVARAAVISAQAEPTAWPSATLAILGLAAPLAKNERFARAQAKALFVPPTLFPDYLRTSRSLSKGTLLAAVGENLRFTAPQAWVMFPGEALVLVGAQERQVMKASALALAHAHPGTEAEIVDSCAHGIPLQNPGWLAGRLLRWLP